IGPWVRQKSAFGAVEAWVRQNTSRDAVFAVPPSRSSFRSATERTIVVNFKSIPYDDRDLRVWFRRLMDLAPLDPLPARGSPDLPARLDEAFDRQTADALLQLSRQYRFDYVIRSAPLQGAAGRFREVFR